MKRAILNLPLPMYTKIRIEKTLDFLQKTWLCTRKWHLERKQEEHEELQEEEEQEEEQA
jgi:hypothetical protein